MPEAPRGDPKELRLKTVAAQLESNFDEGLQALKKASEDGCSISPETRLRFVFLMRLPFLFGFGHA